MLFVWDYNPSESGGHPYLERGVVSQSMFNYSCVTSLYCCRARKKDSVVFYVYMHSCSTLVLEPRRRSVGIVNNVIYSLL